MMFRPIAFLVVLIQELSRFQVSYSSMSQDNSRILIQVMPGQELYLSLMPFTELSYAVRQLRRTNHLVC